MQEAYLIWLLHSYKAYVKFRIVFLPCLEPFVFDSSVSLPWPLRHLLDESALDININKIQCQLKTAFYSRWVVSAAISNQKDCSAHVGSSMKA